MVRIDRFEGAAATDLLRWMFGESNPTVGTWGDRLQPKDGIRSARVLLFGAIESKEIVAGFLFYQATLNGPAQLLDWRVSDAWTSMDPTFSFRPVAEAAIDAGAGWVQWNRMKTTGALPEDSWWQPDFIGDLMHWEKQLHDPGAKFARCIGADSQCPTELERWQVLLLEAKELTAYLSDFADTMQQHSDFPELDQLIQPERWIAEQLADCESSWVILACDTNRSPKEVAGLVLWHLDSKAGWEMRWLGVKPGWRGLGVASHLVTQSLEILGYRKSLTAGLPRSAQSDWRGRETSRFWINCDNRNRPMIGLLEKLKFCPVYQSSLLFWWRVQEVVGA